MADTEDSRFVRVYRQEHGLNYETDILVDTKTGVNYIFHKNSNSGGLTPLLDKDGKPVVTLIENK